MSKIQTAELRNTDTEELEHRLVEVRQSVSAMPQILERIHYRELPTIYPPTSQAVFALAPACSVRYETQPPDMLCRSALLLPRRSSSQ